MKSLIYLLACTLFIFASCGSASGTSASAAEKEKNIEAQNRATISLLDQIRRLPGIVVRNGVPLFVKASNSINNSVQFEPLYVLDGYVVGNSFRDIDQLVNNANIEKIEVLTDSEASFYGARAANGVIKITTRN